MQAGLPARCPCSQSCWPARQILRVSRTPRSTGSGTASPLASFAAACAFVAVARIRAANRDYHLDHPELHLESSSTVLLVWTTLVAGADRVSRLDFRTPSPLTVLLSESQCAPWGSAKSWRISRVVSLRGEFGDSPKQDLYRTPLRDKRHMYPACAGAMLYSCPGIPAGVIRWSVCRTCAFDESHPACHQNWAGIPPALVRFAKTSGPLFP